MHENFILSVGKYGVMVYRPRAENFEFVPQKLGKGSYIPSFRAMFLDTRNPGSTNISHTMNVLRPVKDGRGIATNCPVHIHSLLNKE